MDMPSTCTPTVLLRRASAWTLGSCLALSLSVAGGCSSENEELTKRLDDLQAQIREVRGAGLAAQDRLDSVERQLQALREQARDAAAQNPGDRPTLPVVRLGPDHPPGAEEPGVGPSESEAGPGAAPGSRPLLRGDERGASIEAEGASTGKPAAGRGNGPKATTTGAAPGQGKPVVTGGQQR